VSPSLDSTVRSVVQDTLARMRALTDAVRSGQWRGASGRPVSDILHIGIGGSQLGPELACEALHRFAHPRLRIHFLGNIDPDRWFRLSQDLNPLTTLVIVASKSWRTPETARNAQAVRQWLVAGGVAESELARHLVAVSSNLDAAQSLGVAPNNILPCPDWVGGRYSVWGAVGLPVMMQVGAEAFDQMLSGARGMDRHFAQSSVSTNAPMMLALVSAWNAARLSSGTEAVIPYADALRRFAAHLQQLQMESNGKSVSGRGEPLSRASMPVVWGEPGTDSQHSFFQALHQGVAVHPVDLILVGGSADTDPWQRARALNANAVAQAQALSLGHADTDPQRVHPGGRPVTLIHLPQLDPAALGALIALYEHKTACLGWLWGLNPFDQWGVELGKRLAVGMEAQLASDAPGSAATLDATGLDAATRETLQYLRAR
jgi:glucose-6-phosphate isomerase